MFVKRPDARLFSPSFSQGPLTVLALGGWVGSGEVWHELFAHLPAWRCISFDHRGTGASTHGPGPITVQAMVDDVLAVADAQRVGCCVLAAESSGAGVALQAVQQQPGRFVGLLLVGGAWQRPEPKSQDAFIERLRRDYDGELRSFVRHCLPEPDSEDWQRWGLKILQRASLQHAIELLQCRAELTAQDHLDRVRLPVLLVHGKLDRISPPSASEQLARALPDAELHLLDGLGHVPIFTAPERVARLIDARFVNSELRAACRR